MIEGDDRDVAEGPDLGDQRLEAKDHKGVWLDDKRSSVQPDTTALVRFLHLLQTGER